MYPQYVGNVVLQWVLFINHPVIVSNVQNCILLGLLTGNYFLFGLCNIQDGSYSRGPVDIPVGEVDDSNYYLSPTFKFEQVKLGMA